jgi:hypothetical protein
MTKTLISPHFRHFKPANEQYDKQIIERLLELDNILKLFLYSKF